MAEWTLQMAEGSLHVAEGSRRSGLVEDLEETSEEIKDLVLILHEEGAADDFLTIEQNIIDQLAGLLEVPFSNYCTSGHSG